MSGTLITSAGRLWQLEVLNGLGSRPVNNGNSRVILYTALVGGLNADAVYNKFQQPTFTGYAPLTLTGAGAPTVDSNGYAKIEYAPVNFQPTGPSGLPAVVLGYMVYDTSTATVLWASPFVAAFQFQSTSSVLTITPSLSMGQL